MNEPNNRLPRLNIPVASLNIKDEEGVAKVFDPIRKKFVTLSPEEYVRQSFVNWLIQKFHYPASFIANEISIEFNNTKKRCDTVVFDRELKPLVIVEYKAPHIEITQTVFDQIVRYNMELKARYLIVSNGIRHYCCAIDYTNNTYNFIPVIPDYLEATKGFHDN